MRATLIGAATLVAVAAGVPSHAAAGSASASVPVVRLTIHNSRFSARSITIPPGRVVRFVVQNRDPIDHELIIGPADVQVRHELGTEARHAPRPGEVTVPAGRTAETTYVLPSTTPVLFGCHSPGHWDYGMHGVVQAVE